MDINKFVQIVHCTLTFHKLKNKAICHHCSFEKEIKSKCKLNDDCDFIMYGPGVEKIFEE